MKILGIEKIEKSAEHKKMFERSGFKMTGELLVVESNPYEKQGGLPTTTKYVVFKGKYTPYQTVVDYGDFYILAQHSSYTKINKSDLSVEHYVDDITGKPES